MNEIVLVNNALSAELSKDIAELEVLAKEYESKKKSVRDQLKKAMEESGIIKIYDDNLIITYIPKATQEKLDTKALKEDFPDIYNEYCNITPKSAYIKVEVK